MSPSTATRRIRWVNGLIRSSSAWLGSTANSRPPTASMLHQVPSGSKSGRWICGNARRRRAVIVFWDDSGASLPPVTRRSWAPRGNTPVVRHHFNWKRCSMAAAICYGSHGGGAEVAFHHQQGAYNTETLIGVLEELRRFLGGQKATLVWDGLPAHRSLAMAAWLRGQRSWLVTERLPGYAPEPNPVEGAVVQPQRGGAGHLAGDTLDEVAAAAERGIQRIRSTHWLAFSFLRHCGLSLW